MIGEMQIVAPIMPQHRGVPKPSWRDPRRRWRDAVRIGCPPGSARNDGLYDGCLRTENTLAW